MTLPVLFQHCASVPVYVTKRVKETECQQCQRYYETEPSTKYVRQCNPIFDEKCSTEYIRHCKTTQRCLMIYQTVCNSQGYEQHCTNEVTYIRQTDTKNLLQSRVFVGCT